MKMKIHWDGMGETGTITYIEDNPSLHITDRKMIDIRHYYEPQKDWCLSIYGFTKWAKEILFKSRDEALKEAYRFMEKKGVIFEKIKDDKDIIKEIAKNSNLPYDTELSCSACHCVGLNMLEIEDNIIGDKVVVKVGVVRCKCGHVVKFIDNLNDLRYHYE